MTPVLSKTRAALWIIVGLVRGPVDVTGDDVEIVRGRELARKVCGQCHLLPTPDLLDQRTWREGALPLMYKRLGFAKLDPTSSPGAAQVLKDWQSICNYYIQSAPDRPIPTIGRPKIEIGLPGFDVIDPGYRPGKQQVSFLQIDSSSRQIQVGNAATHTLDILDSNGNLLSEMPVDSPPSSLVHGASCWYLALIGSISPSDEPRGKIWRLDRKGDAFVMRDEILGQLRRPTDVVCADLNQDGREDLVICGFGNLVGRLSWYENAGDRWVEHPLLDGPGAVRSWVLDVNRDGLPDILVLMAQGQEGIYLFVNEGGGHFRPQTVVARHPLWGSAGLDVGDVDGDGAPDLVAANGDNGEYPSCLKNYHGVRIYRNMGGGQFAETFFYPLNGAYRALPLYFNGRKRPDIAAISFFPDYDHAPEESFVYLRDEGEGQYRAFSIPQAHRGRWLTMSAGDLNGDGAPDIVLGAFDRTPFSAPRQILETWRTNGPSLLIVRSHQP